MAEGMVLLVYFSLLILFIGYSVNRYLRFRVDRYLRHPETLRLLEIKGVSVRFQFDRYGGIFLVFLAGNASEVMLEPIAAARVAKGLINDQLSLKNVF